MSSRLERLLHFVTGPSARDVPKVGIGSVAALQRVTKRHQAVTGQLLPFVPETELSFERPLLS